MSTWMTVVTAIGAVLALWSITWIVKAQRTGSGERRLEDDARARVADGEGWDGPLPPQSFTDAELATLAQAQQPLTLEQAGVVALPLTRRRGLRRPPKAGI